MTRRVAHLQEENQKLREENILLRGSTQQIFHENLRQQEVMSQLSSELAALQTNGVILRAAAESAISAMNEVLARLKLCNTPHDIEVLSSWLASEKGKLEL